MTFVDAEVELQHDMGGLSMVLKNPETGACLISDDVDPDKIKDVFGDEVVQE